MLSAALNGSEADMGAEGACMATKRQHYDVFISYAQSRRKLTASLAKDIEAAGFSTWWDTSVLAGDDFLRDIEERLDECKVAVIIWTKESVQSAWVRSEASHALRLNKLINTHERGVRADQIPKPFDQFHSVSLRERAAIIDAIEARAKLPREPEAKIPRADTEKVQEKIPGTGQSTKRGVTPPPKSIAPGFRGWLIMGILVVASLFGVLAGDQFLGTEAPEWEFDQEALYLGPGGIPLRWRYESAGDAAICFELQSALDRKFELDRRTKACTHANWHFARKVNGTRYWRVRAANAQTKTPISRWSDVVKATQYDDAYERIKDTGEVRVLYATPQDQDIFRFDTNEGVKGLDGELAQLIIKELTESNMLNRALTEQPKFVAWKEVLHRLRDGEADFAIASITRTKDRESRYDISFSDTYFCTNYALVYPVDTADGTIANMIAGKKVGVQVDSTNALLGEALGKKIQFDLIPFDTTEELTNAVLASRMAVKIDFVITDTSFAQGVQLKTQLGDKNRLAVKEFTSADLPESLGDAQIQEYGIAVHQRDDRLEEIVNGIIAEAKQNGTLSRLFEEASAEFEIWFKARPGSRQLKEKPWECQLTSESLETSRYNQ